ncbi:MAG: hypothetical protein RLZZ01_489 [Actinomycetota bacterium]
MDRVSLPTDPPIPPPRSTPGWTITFGATERHEPVRGRHGLLALGNGIHSVVGDLTLVAGAYGRADDGAIRPLPGPVWTSLPSLPQIGGAEQPSGPTSIRAIWHLDLRRGVLHGDHHDGRRETRFVSITRPSLGALRVETDVVSGAEVAAIDPDAALTEPAHDPLAARFVHRRGRNGGHRFAETIGDRATVRVAVVESEGFDTVTHRLDRLVSIGRIDHDDPSSDAIGALLDRSLDDVVDFDHLLAEHTAAWADRWDRADVEIEQVDGDDHDQLAMRFALFHLLSCADHRGRHGEATIAARGLTGLAYAGHVFWDTEMFVLPALTAIAPTAARAALRYRERRIPAARRRAAEEGRQGARFPWESADTGDDVTPRSAPNPDGGTIDILTGVAAEHVDAAIAWAAHRHAMWTGDHDYLHGPGRPLLVETARWWVHRTRVADDGTAHLDGVIGPDEYHELVDDNTYTDQMARWNLLAAADLSESAEAERWRDLAERFETDRSIRRDTHAAPRDTVPKRFHTQFAGFEDLDASSIACLGDRPVAADVLLGHDRIGSTQISKQPDVLMLHHVLPDWCGPGWLDADLDHYLPRTAHGSSLSPAICASLLARAGRADEAMRWFDVAARLDLDDLTGSTHEGLHLATMGGLWQAIVIGFAGIRLDDDLLIVEPDLPSRWRRLAVSFTVRGAQVRVVVDHRTSVVEHDGRISTPPVRIGVDP